MWGHQIQQLTGQQLGLKRLEEQNKFSWDRLHAPYSRLLQTNTKAKKMENKVIFIEDWAKNYSVLNIYKGMSLTENKSLSAAMGDKVKPCPLPEPAAPASCHLGGGPGTGVPRSSEGRQMTRDMTLLAKWRRHSVRFHLCASTGVRLNPNATHPIQPWDTMAASHSPDGRDSPRCHVCLLCWEKR